MPRPPARSTVNLDAVRPLRAIASLFVSLTLHTCAGAPLVLVSWLMNRDQADAAEIDPEQYGGAESLDDLADEVAPIPVNVTALFDEAAPPTTEVAAAVPAEPASPGPGPKRAMDGGDEAAVSSIRTRGTRDVGERSAASEASRGKRKDCPKTDGITRVEKGVIEIERDVVHYYATHLNELDRIASAGFHPGPDGKPDGFKLAMPRCSPLRDGGLRVGDIIQEANGRKVTNLPQCVAAWFAVKGDDKVTVKLLRKGEPMTLTYHLVD